MKPGGDPKAADDCSVPAIATEGKLALFFFLILFVVLGSVERHLT